jgi:hypothetical protein
MNGFVQISQKSVHIFDTLSVKRGLVELEYPPISPPYIHSTGTILVLDRNKLVKYIPSDFTDENDLITYRTEPILIPVDTFSHITGLKDTLALSSASGRVYLGRLSDPKFPWTALAVSAAPLTSVSLHPSGFFAAAVDTLGNCTIISLYDEKDHVSMYLDAKHICDVFTKNLDFDLPAPGGLITRYPVHAWVSDVVWSPCGNALLVALRVGGFFLLDANGLHHCDIPSAIVVTAAVMVSARRAALTTEKCGQVVIAELTTTGEFRINQVTRSGECQATASRRSITCDGDRVAFTTCMACGFSRSISL